VPELLEVQECAIGREVLKGLLVCPIAYPWENTDLKLNKQLRERFGHLLHEFFHEICHHILRYTLMAQAKVQWVIDILLRVGPEVKANRQRGRRPNAGTGDVERQLADRNGHAVHAQVAETEDAGT
jgi:hypothetical protein